MKTVSYLLFFVCCMNSSSVATLAFDEATTSPFKNDSIATIPEHFLAFQKNSKGYCLVKGNSKTKKVALTFDDGPTDVSIKIMEILQTHKAKATFFWVGERIQKNEEAILMAQQNEHLIANHSWNHANGFSFSNQYLWESQVENTFQEFSDHGIDEATFYRPPFGAITQEQIDFLVTKNIKTVLWSITTMDWDSTQNSEGQMFQKFKEELHPGAIVLMHDFDFGNLNSKLNDLEKILNYGISQGYKFVTVAELNH